MKKNLSFNLMMVISVLISTITPLLAQPKEQSSFARRISRITPRSSLPSWAKGPGFEAAKKWWKAGRDESVLNNKEKRAFRRFKKKFTIGAIVTAVVAALGAERYYQKRKRDKAATTLQAPIRGAQVRKATIRQRTRQAQAAQQERVKKIFDTSANRSTQDLSLIHQYPNPQSVLGNLWVGITNDSYYLIGPGNNRYAGATIYFNAPTITYGKSENILSFPVREQQGIRSKLAGMVEIIESQKNGTYTYKAYYYEEENAPQAIPIGIYNGIIQVKVLGDLRGDNKYSSEATTTDRINYFGE